MLWPIFSKLIFANFCISHQNGYYASNPSCTSSPVWPHNPTTSRIWDERWLCEGYAKPEAKFEKNLWIWSSLKRILAVFGSLLEHTLVSRMFVICARCTDGFESLTQFLALDHLGQYSGGSAQEIHRVTPVQGPRVTSLRGAITQRRQGITIHMTHCSV